MTQIFRLKPVNEGLDVGPIYMILEFFRLRSELPENGENLATSRLDNTTCNEVICSPSASGEVKQILLQIQNHLGIRILAPISAPASYWTISFCCLPSHCCEAGEKAAGGGLRLLVVLVVEVRRLSWSRGAKVVLEWRCEGCAEVEM